jgi:hypothetical protein
MGVAFVGKMKTGGSAFWHRGRRLDGTEEILLKE